MDDRRCGVLPEAINELLDTRPSNDNCVSCMAVAIREARQLSGRDPETGGAKRTAEGPTWSGALVYLIFAEQVGSCFHLIESGNKPPKRGYLQHALRRFASFSKVESDVLVHLRNRLANDFTLRSEDGYADFVLSTSPEAPVVDASDHVVRIGLPALAIRIEGLRMRVLLAADEGRLGCHHQKGIAGVMDRFRISTVWPELPDDSKTDRVLTESGGSEVRKP